MAARKTGDSLPIVGRDCSRGNYYHNISFMLLQSFDQKEKA
jgi:hypothetical protein